MNAFDQNDDTQYPEVVGVIADQDHLSLLVEQLLASGFDRADISLLSSHESLEALEPAQDTVKNAFAALAGEYRVFGPMAASGAIFLAGGPIIGTIAGVIGAAVTGIAAKEVLEEVLSLPNPEDMERALEAGSIIVWVRAISSKMEKTAIRIFERNGAANIHRRN